ncbi:S-layer homology domain-containing protein [Paenibacillus periandrae]|uniref:S-layer homology domain-containing protein n=1 Tax=Paenibacillus periandrae TaxID=1761741 RepID=UPI001F08CD7C|nr:S-layer homology domain-containing protein [Paenibacillus periandrae]
MMMNHLFKKVLVTGLTLAMVVGGSTAAFADNNKGKGNDKDNDRDKGRDKAQTVQAVKTNYNDKNNKLEIKLTFADVKGSDVEWAMRYIASLASKRVFEGYEDGTFQPRKTITRIEAITAAVRLMGLRDQAESAEAMQANLNFSDADKIKSKYAWATGYVSVALQNDLFEESENAVQPEKEADRLWATTLLVKALKLQNEAKAKMNTKLTFKDANKVPAGSVGYVALAIEKKLVDGYEDNTFRPNNPVTRAELAALLDRTGSQLPDNTSVRGTVNAAVSNNVLTLNVNGQAYSVELDAGAFIYRNGARVAASELRIGDDVVVRTYGGKAIFVEVKTLGNGNQLPDNTTFTASVSTTVSNNTLTLTKDGQTYSAQLDANVSIIRNGVSVAASELRAGDVVSVSTSGGKVIVVSVTTPVNGNQLPDNTTFTASINTTVSNNTLTLTKDGQTYSAQLDANVSIIRNGVSAAASELRVGDSVLVRTYGGKVIFVQVVTPAQDQQIDFTVIGSLNSYTLNTSGQIATISINQTLSSGSVQTAVYNAASNLSIQGDMSLLTTNRSIELRGKNQVVHTIVIR